MDSAKLRAFRAHKQGLIGQPFAKHSPSEILERAGWVRGVGSSAPYQHFATRANFSRGQVDEAVEHMEIHELPAARGCTYIVPKSDFALALRLARSSDPFAPSSPERALGITKEELESLADATLKILGVSRLGVNEIKKGLGDKVRSFGEEGKKRGISTDLPGVISRLQTTGQIRRIPVNGRLDNEKNLYEVWNDNPLLGSEPSLEELHAELAHQFFSWIGPATLEEFQWFSKLPAGKSKAAFTDAALISLEDSYWATPEDADSFEDFRIPSEPDVKLLHCLDNIALLTRCLPLLIDSTDSELTFEGSRLSDSKGFGDPPCHMISDRGRLIGFWLFDHANQRIVYKSWAGDKQLIEKAIIESENRIKEQLGDFRSFSLDSPKSRQPRIQLLSDRKSFA